MIYIGTYTSGKSQGIYRASFDTASGALRILGATPGLQNPSFLALHPGRRFLYAVSEGSGFGGKKSGSVAAYAIAPRTGELTLLNQQSSEGEYPCHIKVGSRGRHALVANYGTGTVAALPIDAEGKLAPASSVDQHQGSGPNKGRQEGPHAHSVFLSPDEKFALSADLGTDRVMLYLYDTPAAALAPNNPPSAPASAPGAGPRHLEFHPARPVVYVINELSSTVAVYRWDAKKGALSLFQSVSTLPQGFSGDNTTADIHVHPSGKFLYGSNRGHDSLAIFAIDGRSGKLKPIGHQSTLGKTPRNFAIHSSGNWILAANQNSDSVVVFKVDARSGKLSPVGAPVEVPSPVCVAFADLEG